MTPEGKVKKLVDAMLKRFGDRVYYNKPVPSGYGESMLDYVGCCGGRFFMIETKREGKKPTPLQNLCRKRVLDAGGKVFTIIGPDDPELGYLETWLEQYS